MLFLWLDFSCSGAPSSMSLVKRYFAAGDRRRCSSKYIPKLRMVHSSESCTFVQLKVVEFDDPPKCPSRVTNDLPSPVHNGIARLLRRHRYNFFVHGRTKSLIYLFWSTTTKDLNQCASWERRISTSQCAEPTTMCGSNPLGKIHISMNTGSNWMIQRRQ